MITPIWKDYFIEFDTISSPVNYSISCGEDTIFAGKAWANPNTTEKTFKVRINNICENYLTNEFTQFNEVTENGVTFILKDASKKFTIINEDTGEMVDEVTFVYDWSYDENQKYTQNTKTYMDKPINKKYKNGMYFFNTYFNGTNVSLYASQLPNKDNILVTDCTSKYAIYFLNKYGGWNSFLIEGNVSKSENYERTNKTKEGNNNTINFRTSPFITKITKQYEIKTGWLNERESEILSLNLFQTSRIFLHNLETNEIIPINITDTSTTYKTYKNTGRKLLNYTINATASNIQYNKN